jgi:cytochrome c oxidase cbb3-type subunit 4
MTSGFVTLILLLVFLGVVFWAYSSRRKADFDAAARIPLEDHDPNHKDGAKP